MLKLAGEAIMSFSYKPLKIASWVGVLLSSLSFIYLIVTVILKLCGVLSTVAGWASIVAISLFFNGIILMILGILGSYIGRIYEEVKDRPLYIIREKINF